MSASSGSLDDLRIVQVCRTGWPHVGGMESAVGGLAGALLSQGHQVRVVTLDRALTDGRPLPVGRWRGVPYVRLRRVGPRRYPFARGLIRQLRGADIVHVHGLDGLTDLAVATRAVHRARVGISTHGGFFHTGRTRRLKEAWLRTVTRRTLRRADAVWFTSAADNERLGAAGISGTVIENGVEVDRFADLRRHPRTGRWVVLGRIDVHKGLEDLIDALAIIARKDPRPFVVDVVGRVESEGLREDLRVRVAAWDLGDRLHFHGEVDTAALRWLLGRAELALFPSRYEGFGIAVVEMMAAGVPVVVSTIPAFARLVRPDVEGYCVDFGDPAAAAEHLVALRQRDHEPLVAAARERAQGYRWGARVREWETAYRALLSGTG
jgi:alpha-1,3-mannosyltransferase